MARPGYSGSREARRPGWSMHVRLTIHRAEVIDIDAGILAHLFWEIAGVGLPSEHPEGASLGDETS